MAIIVACDPGGIKPGTHSGTGYAVLDTEGMKILRMEIANHKPSECADHMQALYRHFMTNYIVAEGFTPRWGQPFSLDSVYLLGGMQAVIGEDRLKLVLPSQHTSKDPKKAFTPVPKLTKLMKDQGYKVGEGHSRMALSVAIYYAVAKLKDKNAIDWKANRV